MKRLFITAVFVITVFTLSSVIAESSLSRLDKKAIVTPLVEKILLDKDGAFTDIKQEKETEEALRAIYDALSPPGEAYDIGIYFNSGDPIPTRQTDNQEFKRLLDQAKHLVQIRAKMVNTDGEGNYFKEELIFNNIAENDRWRVVKFSYLKRRSAWGILLVFDKEKQLWTSFYSSSVGGSNVIRHLDRQVELVDGQLSVKFDPDAQQLVTITLPGFRVRKAHQYAFGDYLVESLYTGPIATLNTKSSEFASIFPTLIRATLKKGVDFAGHFTVMIAGCGTQCQMIAITDVISGNVVAELQAQRGVEYKAASRLLIVDVNINCLDHDSFYQCTPRYYKMTHGQLIELTGG